MWTSWGHPGRLQGDKDGWVNVTTAHTSETLEGKWRCLTLCYRFEPGAGAAEHAAVNQHLGVVVNVGNRWRFLSQVTGQSSDVLTLLFHLELLSCIPVASGGRTVCDAGTSRTWKVHWYMWPGCLSVSLSEELSKELTFPLKQGITNSATLRSLSQTEMILMSSKVTAFTEHIHMLIRVLKEI